MPKKMIGIRLDQEVVDQLTAKGKPSTVIRNIVLASLNPKPKQEVKTITNTILKEVPTTITRYVGSSLSGSWEAWNRKIDLEVIKEEIKDRMPKWIVKESIKDFFKKYGRDQNLSDSFKKVYGEEL